jgi:hypothetical protein
LSDDEKVIKPHSLKQQDIIFSDSKDTVAVTGTQFGKSQAGALWMKLKTHTYTDERDNFLLTAPSYKIMQQSMLPYFLECMRGFGEYLKSEACFKIYAGGTVFMRTNTDPDSIVGIPNIRAYWGDEVGKYTLYFWENIRARVASKGAETLLTTSPYTMNWLWRDIIKPKLDGKLPEIKLIRAASWENPYHSLHDPKVRFAEEARMDPRRFAMIYGGEFGKMQGLVYDCWDDDENYVKPFDLPFGTRYLAGVDWGYTDPFCLLVRAITPDGMQYGVSEFYKARLSPSEIINIARQKMQTFKIERFVCDPSRPDMIEEFNRNGLPAIKANNDIKFGIGVHYDLIKARKYKEFIGACPYSKDERELYHYPEPKDLGPDDKQKELLPVDANNHAQDCLRYLSIEARTFIKEKPMKPLKSTNPFDAILKASRNQGTENFS